MLGLIAVLIALLGWAPRRETEVGPSTMADVLTAGWVALVGGVLVVLGCVLYARGFQGR